MPPSEAIKIARQQRLDLVEISATAQPPVCRIMDHGKFLYQESKRAHEARKRQHHVVVKEVKFRPNVDEHDYQFKKNHVARFLTEGDKVKVVIVFRGREITHSNIGRQVLERLIQDISGLGMVESRGRMEGHTIIAILAPKKQAQQSRPQSSESAGQVKS
jgi:translation initiation factor IF-3